MSAGPGDQSRIYHTADAGQHWQLQFTNANPKAFFDSMVFWDPTHGIVLGDPIPDETGKLKFELLITNDGQTWTQLPPAQLPPALEGEGAFAASNTCSPSSRDREGHDFSRAVNASEKSGASAPRDRPQHLVRHRRQSSPRLPLPRPRPNLASLRYSHPPRPRLRRNLLHRLPRPNSRRNRRRRLQTSRPGRSQPGLHHRRRQNLDPIQDLPPGLLFRA